MQSIRVRTDQNHRELSEHGTMQFPLEINHDHLIILIGMWVAIGMRNLRYRLLSRGRSVIRYGITRLT